MAEAILGAGALAETFKDVDGAGWVVLGGVSSFTASGADEALESFLSSGAELHAVPGPVPTVEAADCLINQLQGRQVRGFLAVGGGLVIDTMKLVALGLATGLSAHDLVDASIETRGDVAATIAAPTTAGSGAERTPFAVVYSDGVKYSVDDPRLLPQTAIIDPTLLSSVPKPVAAAAGLDALAHCVESLWACRSTPDSERIASDALKGVVANLEAAVVDGSDDSQDALAYSASSAGSAIAITRTTAAHALSYHLTSHHGIRHGHAVALTLGALIEVNGNVGASTVSDSRGVQHVRRAVEEVCRGLQIPTPSEGGAAIGRFLVKLGLSPSVDEAASERVDRDLWIQSVNSERLANNPRRLENVDLLEIVNSA